MSANEISRRDLVRAIPGAASLLMVSASNAIGENRTVTPDSPINPVDLVDPELRGALKSIPSFKITTDVNPSQVKMLRALTGLTRRPLDSTVTARAIPGRNGAPDVKLFIINAKEGERRPVIVHMHGGGYVLGDAVSFIPKLRMVAEALGCVIVTVDYRLAPETKFPGSLEDNYAALLWTHANADSLGVDPARIALAGESAGGGHAAMLAIAARDRGEVPVIFQSLAYPMLDDRTGSSRKVPPHIGTFVWNSTLNRFGWESLLGQKPGGESVPAGAVPARVENLAGLPAAWIGTGALDLFVDENFEYARRLVSAAVPAEVIVISGAYHGFDGLVPNASASRRFSMSRFNALARAFGVAEVTSADALS
jgi:acetyl esterase/lipase